MKFLDKTSRNRTSIPANHAPPSPVIKNPRPAAQNAALSLKNPKQPAGPGPPDRPAGIKNPGPAALGTYRTRQNAASW